MLLLNINPDTGLEKLCLLIGGPCEIATRTCAGHTGPQAFKNRTFGKKNKFFKNSFIMYFCNLELLNIIFLKDFLAYFFFISRKNPVKDGYSGVFFYYEFDRHLTQP